MSTHRAVTPTTEPALTVGAISALVSAVLALLVVLGVQLPEGFEAAVLAVLAAAVPIVSAVLIRARVTPNVSVVERVEQGTVIAGPANDLVHDGDPIREHDA